MSNVVRAGQKLYVIDRSSLREVDLTSKDVKTIIGDPIAGVASGYVDGIGPTTRMNGPSGLAWDGDDTLYVADTLNQVIRQVSIATGAITTLATVDANGDLVRFDGPGPIAFDKGYLWVVDRSVLRRVFLKTRTVNTIFGATNRVAVFPGAAALASINQSSQGIGVATDAARSTSPARTRSSASGC